MSIADRPRAEIVERLRLTESQLVITTQRAELAEQQLDAANQRIKELEDNAKTPAVTRVDIDIATRHMERQLEAAERKLADLETVVVVLDKACQFAHTLLDSKSRNADRIEERLRKAHECYLWSQRAQIEQPEPQVPEPEVIETPLDHPLAELYKDPEFLAEYRKEIKEEREAHGLEALARRHHQP